jgi:2-keto-3-deoxy-L-fuconate dehydrogenase
MKQLFNLENKVAMITGAGSGIGKAIAKLFAARGAIVYAVDINETGALETVSEIRESKGSADARICNAASQEEVKKALADIPVIDILVNCAGISHIGNAVNTTEAEFDRIYQVNVKGVYNFLHAVIPVMEKKRSGVILNLSSIAALVGLHDRFAYSMSKGAVMAMTLSVAKDYLASNIRCNSISPARVHTSFVEGFLAKNYPGKEKEMFEKLSASQPIGRMGKPEEIAALALFLCSDEAGFITGCDYPIDGGFIKLNN